MKTINPFQAVLAAAMATTIGMGNIVGPSIAISTGGPGALFWLIAYSFFWLCLPSYRSAFGGKYAYSITRWQHLGWPTQYLRHVSVFFWDSGMEP